MSLYDNLIAAGLPVESATDGGNISMLPHVNMTEAQRQLFFDTLFQWFNPSGWTAYKRIRDRQDASKTSKKSIPNWATWSQSDWQTYFDANLSDAQADLVTSLAAARVMIK